MSVGLTCSMCKHWQAAHGNYASACTNRKAGLGAVIQRNGSSHICRDYYTPKDADRKGTL